MSSEYQSINKENEKPKPEPQPSTSNWQERPIVRRPRGRPARGKSSTKIKNSPDPDYVAPTYCKKTRAVKSKYYLKGVATKGDSGTNDRKVWDIEEMQNYIKVASKLWFKKRLLHRYVSFIIIALSRLELPANLF